MKMGKNRSKPTYRLDVRAELRKELRRGGQRALKLVKLLVVKLNLFLQGSLFLS